MRPWIVPLLLGALLLPAAVLAQSDSQPQIEVRPLGQGYVLPGQSQIQQQGEPATQQQGGSGTQQQGETATQPQGGSGTQQPGETATQQQEEGAAQQPIETATTAEPGPPRQAEGVSLEGLDKITARTFAFEAPLNETVRFGYLEITARRCVVAAEEETPERSAFLEVVEAKPGRNPSKVFSGWMFASSPSVSAMEHAVYDIWVVDCMGYEGEESVETAPIAEAAPEEVEAPVEGVERPLD